MRNVGPTRFPLYVGVLTSSISPVAELSRKFVARRVSNIVLSTPFREFISLGCGKPSPLPFLLQPPMLQKDIDPININVTIICSKFVLENLSSFPLDMLSLLRIMRT